MTASGSSETGAVWRRFGEPRDLLAVHRAHPGKYPFLLESAAHGTSQARYDILFFAGSGTRILQDRHRATPGFLDRLHAEFQELRAPAPVGCPVPFYGGWFLFLSYELSRALEPSLKSMPENRSGWPVALAVRSTAAIVRDHATGQTWLIAERENPDQLAEMMQDLTAVGSIPADPPIPDITKLEEEKPALYLDRIARVKEYIRKGDTYQVNLSRRWAAEFCEPVAPALLYARLRAANPSPFAGLAILDQDRAIVSSSPELLVSVNGGRIRTRPIAGSWPRVNGANDDPAQIAEFRRHPKERAEHIMLVDLERNDLGRLCKPGSVQTDDLLTIESYRHVHHLVSGVSGVLRSGVSPVDVIRAVFPGGTITGCPKLRTMQIIAEQENVPRGAYTGSMGFLNRDGSMTLNILIRSMMLEGRKVEWRAGGGIVADSDPLRELQETRAKAKGLLAALGVSESMPC